MKILPYALTLALTAPAYGATLQDFVKQKSNEFGNTKQTEKATGYAVQVVKPEGYEKAILRLNEFKDGSQFFLLELYRKSGDGIEALVLSDKGADKSSEKYTRANAATESEAVKAAYKAKSEDTPADLAALLTKTLSDLETVAKQQQ